MKTLSQSLQTNFHELYSRKKIATDLLTQPLTPNQRGTVSNGLVIIDIQIENGLKFIGG